jgi:hypothetical protein
MKTYAVSRTINADRDKVWGLLTNATGYAEWNPAVIDIDGRIAAGEKIKLKSIVNPKRTFTLSVKEFSAPGRMVWASGMPLGLFTGARTFTLTPTADGSTEFAMKEEYTGLMAPLITKSIPDMTDSFEQFADGLKTAAEQGG